MMIFLWKLKISPKLWRHESVLKLPKYRCSAITYPISSQFEELFKIRHPSRLANICVRCMVCLVCFALAGLRRLYLACKLAKLASLVRTMLGLLYLQRLSLARSLAKLASLVRTIRVLLGFRRRRLARSLVKLANSRFWVNFRKILWKMTDTHKEIYF